MKNSNHIGAGYVFAGGASRRMGTSKADLKIGERTMIDIAMGTLAEICGDNVWVVGSGLSNPTNVIPDKKPEGAESASGPLVGIYTAVSHSNAEWTAVLACDLPFVSSQLFGQMASFVSADFDGVVPLQEDGRLQPLAALYRTATIKVAAENALVHGVLSPTTVLGEVRTRIVEPAEMYDIPNGEHVFLNVNTPDDLETARLLTASPIAKVHVADQ